MDGNLKNKSEKNLMQRFRASSDYTPFANFLFVGTNRKMTPPFTPLSGLVHSIESMTCVDGKGLRFLVFLQGCFRRCVFCCNPDMWDTRNKAAQTMSVSQIMEHLKRDFRYLKPNGGGLTVSGGEPLLQSPFVTNLFKETRTIGLTTCLDTSGYGNPEDFDPLLRQTDHIMLCIKSLDPVLHRKISGVDISHLHGFVDHVDKNRTSFRIRHVVITAGPFRTNTNDEIDRLVSFANQREHCTGIEILPYHRLGLSKWNALGWTCLLEDIRTPNTEEINKVVEQLRKGLFPTKELIL